jgi:serine/threonine protein kinase
MEITSHFSYTSFNMSNYRSEASSSTDSLSSIDYRVNLDEVSTRNIGITNQELDFLKDFKETTLYAEGTSSILYKCKYETKDVIVKMIKKRLVNDSLAMKEFNIEYNILYHMDHPHIIKLIGSGHTPRKFFVLEYLEAGTLAAELDKSGSVNMKEVLHTARDIADAIDYMHKRCSPGVTIIHRDLKPDNIGFSSNGSVKLFDFGLSICVKRRTQCNEAYEMTGCTGTMRYMAPEAALSKNYNEKVDVYSFGLILWQMLSRQVPFRGARKHDFLDVVVRGGARPYIDNNWPSDLCSLLCTCWHTSPDCRPSFETVVRRLDDILRKFSVESYVEMFTRV